MAKLRKTSAEFAKKVVKVKTCIATVIISSEAFMLLTSDHEVSDLNPAGDEIQLSDCMALHCTESFISGLPSSLIDLNNVERDVKHQTI